jgi:hypothetical protein
MKKLILFSIVALAVLLSSCKKDRFDEPKAPEKMEELSVPANFDWKTTKDFSLTLTSATNGIVEVANTKSIAYQKAFLTPGQSYTMKLTVPSYENTIVLNHSGQTVTLQLSGPSLSYQFGSK